MEFHTREELEGEVIVIETPQRLDASIASDLKTKIGELIKEGKYKLVIDMGRTEFMDSSGLGALVSPIRVIRSNHGDLRIASPGTYILKLLNVTNLNRVFKYFDDVRVAVESF